MGISSDIFLFKRQRNRF